MYIMYTVYMNKDSNEKRYTVAEFRSQIREAFNNADDEVDVIIERFGAEYVLVTKKYFDYLVHGEDSTDTTSSIPKTATEVKEQLKPRKPKPVKQSLPSAKQKLCKHGWPLGGCFDKKKDRSCEL
jgi:hypothetical protein